MVLEEFRLEEAEAEAAVPGDLLPGQGAAALEVPEERLKQEAPGFRATLT